MHIADVVLYQENQILYKNFSLSLSLKKSSCPIFRKKSALPACTMHISSFLWLHKTCKSKKHFFKQSYTHYTTYNSMLHMLTQRSSTNHVDGRGGRGGYQNVHVCPHGGRGVQASVHVDYDSHIFTFDIRNLRVMDEFDIPQITCIMFGF